MQIQADGTPVIITGGDRSNATRFIARLVDKVYDRLPRFVKLFVSRERLVDLLRKATFDLANGL